MRALCALALAASAHAVPAHKDRERPLHLTNLGVFHMQLGGLYDAVYNEVVPAYFVDDMELVKKRTTTMATPFLSQKYTLDSHRSSKFDLLDVSGEVTVTLTAGTFSGTASYLNDVGVKKGTKKMAFISTVHTQTEILDVFHGDIQGNKNRDALPAATHVVTGIVWGQRKIGEFSKKYSNETEKTKIEGSFDLTINKGFKVEISGKVNMTDVEEELSENMAVKIFADEVPETMPTTLPDAMAYLKNVNVGDDFKGVPLYYVLTPLSTVHNEAAQIIHTIDDEAITQAKDVIDQMDDSITRLAALVTRDPMGNRHWADRVRRFQANFLSWRSEYLNQLAKLIRRRKLGEPDNITAHLINYAEHEWYSSRAVEAKADQYEAELEGWIAQIESLRKSDVHVALSAGDVMASQLDQTYDRTYMLLLVDNGGRYGLGHLGDFSRYAGAKEAADGPGEYCTNRIEDKEGACDDGAEAREAALSAENVACVERVKMFAVHFDSYCRALCPAEYCAPTKFEPDRDRVCPTRLNGTTEMPAETCKFSEATAGRLGCVRRNPSGSDKWPAANADGDTESPSVGRPIDNAFCNCPYSMIVEFGNDGSEQKYDLPNAPEKVTISEVRDEDLETGEGAAFAQVVQLILADDDSAENPAHRFLVRVLYDSFDDASGRWTTVQREFETSDSGRVIPVYELAAGRTYRFEVAGINEVGVGTLSEPKALKVREKMAIVSLLSHAASTDQGWDAGLGAMCGGAEGGAAAGVEWGTSFPSPLRNQLPSWAVGGDYWLTIAVELSAQNPSTLVGARFTMPGKAPFECDDYQQQTYDRLVCRVKMAHFVLDEYTGDEGFITVTVLDRGGLEAASRVVEHVQPSRTACQEYEAAEAKHLCEARFIGTPTLVDRVVDPEDQQVLLKLLVGGYSREAAFTRFQVVVDGLEGENTPAVDPVVLLPRDWTGAAVEVRIGGLRAAHQYTFTLVAHASGYAGAQAAPFPLTGFRVGEPMPIIVPQTSTVGPARNNRMPGWLSYRGSAGKFAIKVQLTLPAPSPIRSVEFSPPRTVAQVPAVDADDNETAAEIMSGKAFEFRVDSRVLEAAWLLHGHSREATVEVQQYRNGVKHWEGPVVLTVEHNTPRLVRVSKQDGAAAEGDFVEDDEVSFPRVAVQCISYTYETEKQKALEEIQCEIPMLDLGTLPQNHAEIRAWWQGKFVPVAVKDTNGETVAEGLMERDIINSENCKHWEKTKAVVCRGRVDKCVVDCTDGCTSGDSSGSVMSLNPHGECTANSCSATQVFCPVYDEPCLDDESEGHRKGQVSKDDLCREKCGDDGTAVYYAEGNRCALPCVVDADPSPFVIAAGATTTLECTGPLTFNKQPGASPTVACPPNNAVTEHTKGPWWTRTSAVPECYTCSVEQDCGGAIRGQDVNVSVSEKKCECTCNPRFAGPACEQCSLRWDGQDCDTCSPRFAGPDCEQCKPRYAHVGDAKECGTCSDRFEPSSYPACNVCKPQFAGQDCERCSLRFKGPECQECSERFGGVDCMECSVEAASLGATAPACLLGVYRGTCLGYDRLTEDECFYSMETPPLTRDGDYGGSVPSGHPFIVEDTALPYGCVSFEPAGDDKTKRVVFNKANKDSEVSSLTVPEQTSHAYLVPLCRARTVFLNSCRKEDMLSKEECFATISPPPLSEDGAYGNGVLGAFLGNYATMPHGCVSYEPTGTMSQYRRVMWNQAHAGDAVSYVKEAGKGSPYCVEGNCDNQKYAMRPVCRRAAGKSSGMVVVDNAHRDHSDQNGRYFILESEGPDALNDAFVDTRNGQDRGYWKPVATQYREGWPIWTGRIVVRPGAKGYTQAGTAYGHREDGTQEKNQWAIGDEIVIEREQGSVGSAVPPTGHTVVDADLHNVETVGSYFVLDLPPDVRERLFPEGGGCTSQGCLRVARLNVVQYRARWPMWKGLVLVWERGDGSFVKGNLHGRRVFVDGDDAGFWHVGDEIDFDWASHEIHDNTRLVGPGPGLSVGGQVVVDIQNSGRPAQLGTEDGLYFNLKTSADTVSILENLGAFDGKTSTGNIGQWVPMVKQYRSGREIWQGQIYVWLIDQGVTVEGTTMSGVRLGPSSGAAVGNWEVGDEIEVLHFAGPETIFPNQRWVPPAGYAVVDTTNKHTGAIVGSNPTQYPNSQFFQLNLSDADLQAVFAGQASWEGVVTQFRRGWPMWRGNVVIWPEGTGVIVKGNAHGRRNPTAADGEWRVGDEIVLDP